MYTYEVTISTYRNQEPNICVEDWNIGNPKMFLTGLELALGNGETCLWTYSNVENIRLLIDFCFFVLAHMIIMGQNKLEMLKRTFGLLKQSCLPG